MTVDTELVAEPIEEGKRISITRKPTAEGQDPEVITGTVEVANEFGYLIKPKGSSRAILLRVQDVLDYEVLEDETETLKATNVKPVNEATVKRHLLNYHGQPLSEVNSWSTSRALEVHEDLHRIHGGEVGHRHVEPKSEGDNGSE